MLDSKRDRSIKRYLSKISSSKFSASYYSSFYYYIEYNEEVKIKVRFSDHFHDEKGRLDIKIDIIKTSFGFYTIKLITAGLSYTVNEDNVLPYIKSILLLYPEFNDTLTNLKKTSKLAVQNTIKMSEKANNAVCMLNKKTEYTEMVDKIYEENKILIGKISELRREYNNTKSQLETYKTNLSNLKVKNAENEEKCRRLRARLNKIKDAVDSIV